MGRKNIEILREEDEILYFNYYPKFTQDCNNKSSSL